MDELILYGNIIEEHNFSMERYRESVMPLLLESFSVTLVRPKYYNFFWFVPAPKKFTGNRMFSILIMAPLQVLFLKKKGRRFLIVDHSYGFLARFLGKHSVVVLHDLIPLTPLIKKSHPGFHPDNLFFQISAHSLRFAKKIISVSHYNLEDIRSYIPKAEEKVIVIHEGIADTIEYVDVNFTQKKYLELIHVGTNHERKNIECIVEMLRILKNNTIPVRLVKIGSPFTEHQQKLILDADVGSLITHIGNITDEELSQRYSFADVLVFPSLAEGFGFPVLEAMKCHCAVVALKRTSLTELLGNVGVGIEENNPNDFAIAVESLYRNPEKLKQIKTLSCEWSTNFTWRNHVRQLIDVLKS